MEVVRTQELTLPDRQDRGPSRFVLLRDARIESRTDQDKEQHHAGQDHEIEAQSELARPAPGHQCPQPESRRGNPDLSRPRAPDFHELFTDLNLDGSLRSGCTVSCRNFF